MPPTDLEADRPTGRVLLLPPRATPPGPAPWVRRSAFVLTLVLLGVSIPLLARFGWQQAVEAEGRISALGSADSSAPGYRALVSPTRTMLVLHRAPGGELAGVALLAAAGDEGGAVLPVPLSLLTDTDGPRPRPLGETYERGGVDAVAAAVGSVLRLGFSEVVTADPQDWQAAMADRRVVVDNPDELTDESGAVVFAAGKVTIDAGNTESYLRLRRPGEDEQSRLYRQRLFWRAWLGAVRAKPGTTPETPLGEMVDELAQGVTEVATLPLVEPDGSVLERAGALSGNRFGPLYQIDTVAAPELLATIVPLPSSAQPGDRVRVRLLDGTGDAAATLATSARLVPAGAEIVVFGNADRFDHADSEVTYFSPGRKADAEAFAAVLGVASVVYDAVGDPTVDVSVTVGRDLVGG